MRGRRILGAGPGSAWLRRFCADILSYEIADIHRISIEMAADVAAAIARPRETRPSRCAPRVCCCCSLSTGPPGSTGRSCNFIPIFLICRDYIIIKVRGYLPANPRSGPDDTLAGQPFFLFLPPSILWLVGARSTCILYRVYDYSCTRTNVRYVQDRNLYRRLFARKMIRHGNPRTG